MEGCVFYNFVDKEVVVFKDDQCFAAVSKNPINKCHVLVVPREHYENFVDLPDELAQTPVRYAASSSLTTSAEGILERLRVGKRSSSVGSAASEGGPDQRKC